MAGRPRKPSEVKRLAGTYRADRTAPNEPKPRITSRTPSPPIKLSPVAAQEWKRMARELHGLGLLTVVDLTALVAYCETFATWQEALGKIRETGLLVKASTGTPVQNPYLNIASAAEKRLRGWLQEFGCTPSSRTRVSAPGAGDDSDPYEAFLSQETPVPDELRKWAVADDS